MGGGVCPSMSRLVNIKNVLEHFMHDMEFNWYFLTKK